MSDASAFSFNVLASYAVRDTDGKFNFDATMAKFGDRLLEFGALCEQEEGKIGAAVNKVFDEKVSKGGTINMDAIVTFAMPSMNPNADNYAYLANAIKDWVRLNSDVHEKKSKEGVVLREAEAPRTRAFYISKGKGGGVRRWADVEVKPDAE